MAGVWVVSGQDIDFLFSLAKDGWWWRVLLSLKYPLMSPDQLDWPCAFIDGQRYPDTLALN